MKPDEQTWEHEIERELARWSADLAVEMPPDVRDRTRAVVRHTMESQWLAGHPAPLPSDGAVDRVRLAVRRELTQLAASTAGVNETFPEAHRGQGVPPAHGRLLAWPGRYVWASLAAAASVLVVIGITRQQGPSETPPIAQAQPRQDAMDLFVQAAGRAWADDQFTSGLRTDLDALEESLNRWSPAVSEVERMLEDIGDRLDGLFDDSDDDRWPASGWAEGYS